MSCRVLNRTAEHFLMNAIIEQASQKGFKRIIGEYILTAKNKMVKDLFLTFGFETCNQDNNHSFFKMTIPVISLQNFIATK
jgi:predicted enzyme involved in methoxymalonyl-ACP biosynthesis